MAINKEELYRLVDRLNKQDQKTAFDFLEFLVNRSKQKPKYWENVDKTNPDNHPLSEQELEQLNSEEGYISGEDAQREFGLQVDLP